MPARPRRTDPDEAMRYVGKRVWELRKARGLSQSGLAAAAGVPEATVSRVENGKSNTELKTLIKLANALRVKPAELLP